MDLKRRILYLEKEREKERGERHPEVYVSDDAGQEGDEQLLPGQEGDGQLLRGGMPPRGRKQWENLTPKHRNRLAAGIKENLENLAQERNTTPAAIISDVTNPVECNIVIASWFATRGRDGGFGQRIWRQSKTVFHHNRICTFPPFERLTSYWKREIVPEVLPTRDSETNAVNGARFHIGDFMKQHMKRWIEAQFMLGRPLPPGYYETHWKSGMDSGRHAWYRWRDEANPAAKKTTVAIGILDATLLSGIKSSQALIHIPSLSMQVSFAVKNAGAGTLDFHWEEPSPNSEDATRVTGFFLVTVFLLFNKM